MKFSSLADIEWVFIDSLNVSIGLSDTLPCNEFADIVYAKLAPKATLTLHYHNRPHKDGYECFFFFQGADITMHHPEQEDKPIRQSEPFHMTFADKDPHGFTNNSDTDLIFEVITAPKHQEGEVVIL